MVKDGKVYMQHILSGFGKFHVWNSEFAKEENWKYSAVVHCTRLLSLTIHQAAHNAWCKPFNMFQDKNWHDWDDNYSPSCWEYICNLSILQANDFLPVDLTDVLNSEKAISGSRTIIHYDCDFSTFRDEANLPTAVLMHSNCPLKGSIANGHSNLLPNACLRTLYALSELQPAQFSPLIWSIWSPNHRPTKEAGNLPGLAEQINHYLLT